MSIRIDARRFNNEFRANQNLPFLLGCIGEKITVETDFYFEYVFFSNTDQAIRFIPDPPIAGTLEVSSMIMIDGGTFFEKCAVGDSILVYDITNPSFVNNGTYIIKEIIDGSQARMTTNFTVLGTVPSGASGGYFGASGDQGYIANVTPLKGVKYNWNFVEDGNSFISLIDEEAQVAEIGVANAGSFAGLDMLMLGENTYKTGKVFIRGRQIINQQQKFTIVHETVITPLFLADQYSDLLLRKKPTYFEANKCLNYISRIEVGRSLNDPNGLTVLDVENQASNTGWFNENFNGKQNIYIVDSLVISRVADLTIINQLEFTGDIQVDVIISNPVDSFFASTSKCVFGFNYLPETEELYRDNGRTLNENFLFDSKSANLNLSIATGQYAGTARQIIKSVEYDIIDAKHAKLKAVVNFGATSQAILREGDFSRYMMWVIVENPNLAADLSDKVNLLLQVAEVYEQLTTVDLIDAATVFLEHHYTDPAQGKPTLDMFPVDDVISRTDFSIDFTGHETEGIKILSVKPAIKLKHATNADITLESFAVNTNNYPLIGTLPGVQNIQYQQDRVFKREDGNRKSVVLKREFVNDLGLIKSFSLNYPFMHRWEYWIALQNIANIPSSLFDSTKPLNGLNNLWDRLESITGWTLNYDLEFTILQNGKTFIQSFSYPLQSQYFLANTEWTNCSIKSYDTDTNSEITNASVQYLHGYKNTKIVATFQKTTGAIPDISQVAMAIWIEPFEGLGISDIRLASSEYNLIPLSWFLSINSTNKVSLSQTGGVFTGSVLVDSSKLPANKRFTVYARIYEKTGVTINYILQEDDFYILQEDGFKMILE